MMYLFYLFPMVICAISADPVVACDKSKCRGVGNYLTNFQCIPIYGPDDNCCPIKYNCESLKQRAVDKCYYKDHIYEIGDRLRSEDATPCNIGCSCTSGYDNHARFTCATVDCFGRSRPGCYLKANHTRCCPGPLVCPNTEENLAKCEVDGKTYLDGQRFTPASDPKKSCICSEGYKGENIEPFCKDPKPLSCTTELHHSTEQYQNCIPTFYGVQNPATDCSYALRCQNDKDRVIPGNGTRSSAESDPSDMCTFGQLKMNIGDELNQATDYSSVCVKCVCEVPPVPTCQRLPDDECDVTVHPVFENSWTRNRSNRRRTNVQS